MNQKVSIVIPSYRRKKMLVELLHSLEKSQLNLEKTEIIIVDDGSPDADKKEKFVRENTDLPLTYLRQKNSGPATARNLGVSKSSGDIIVFLDDDIEVTPGWIDEIIRGYDDKLVGGIAGYTKEFQKKTTVEKYLAFVEHLHRHQFSKDGTLDYICTANSSFQKSAFLAVGGFSSELRLPAGDDMDLGFKLVKCGYKLRYNPKAVALHKHRSTLYQMFKLFFVSGRGAYRCSALHKDHVRNNVTRHQLVDIALIFKVLFRSLHVISSRLREQGQHSYIRSMMYFLFEITNHVFYQLGRYYEFFMIKLGFAD